jgi:hypothetical protein
MGVPFTIGNSLKLGSSCRCCSRCRDRSDAGGGEGGVGIRGGGERGWRAVGVVLGRPGL